MPVDQPNREAQPVVLEANVTMATLVNTDSEYVPWFNNTANVYQMGEIFVSGGAVWVCIESILPSQVGARTSNFVVDAVLDPAHTGNIAQDALIYLDTDLADADQPMGYATAVEPTNGFVIGRATASSGATSVNVATTGSTTVRVRSSAADFAEFSA